jgi:hypothetical protein
MGGDSGGSLGGQLKGELSNEELLEFVGRGVSAKDQPTSISGWEVDVEHLSIWIARSCSKTDRGVSPGALRRSL